MKLKELDVCIKLQLKQLVESHFTYLGWYDLPQVTLDIGIKR